MIELKNISKRFGKQQALDSVSLTLEANQCVALIGPNGSGKTTLMKVLLGMVLPDEGEMRFNEKNMRGEWLYKRAMGYMPQIGRYPENMTVEQVMNMIIELRENPTCDEELGNQFQINEWKTKRIQALSGGMRQKVSACLAFLFNPDVLILDEPTAGLDPVATLRLKAKIEKEKNKGKLIIISSHVLSELDNLVSHIVFLHEGKIIFHDTIAHLRRLTKEEKLENAIAHFMTSKSISA